MTWMATGGTALAASLLAVLGWLSGDKDDMVLIPSGPAILGDGDVLSLEGPQLYDVPAFEIDRFEVTNAQFSAFVEATGAAPSGFFDVDELNQPDQPVTGVLWKQAEAYCRWAGKRLPTEIEWEKAARGTDGQTYPWGDAQTLNLAHLEADEPAPVHAFESDVSPYGVRGMAGNVSEWVADTRIAEGGVCGTPHHHESETEPFDPSLAYLAELAAITGAEIGICRNPDINPRFAGVEPCAFIKGNSFAGLPHMTKSANRMWDYTETYADFVGFRCARDAG